MFCEYCLNDVKLICSACKTTRYCSAACQSADWKTHKQGCKFNQICNEANAKMALKPPSRPPVGRCTGCNMKFDGEESFCEDACEDCGYQVCESCSVDQSNGTCYCPNKNFGNMYCTMSPRWYHSDGRGRSYKGDRHPEVGDEYSEEDYEPEPRKCATCGDVAYMLKKEFL